MAWCRLGDKPLSEPMIVSLLTYMCVTRPQWFKERGNHKRHSTAPLNIISLRTYKLTHWGRVTHICVGKLTIIGSDNGLSPGRRQAIFWTNAGILLIRPLGTNFSEILSEIQSFSFKKMHLKMSSVKWRPFCFGLKVLRSPHPKPETLNDIGKHRSYSRCRAHLGDTCWCCWY